jgi:flagellar motor switch protein FliN/FliY
MTLDRERAKTGRTASFLLDLEVPVTVRFARKRMLYGEVAAIGSGSVIPLDRSPDDLVELQASDTLIARGHIVRADGNCAIQITELVRCTDDKARAGGRRQGGEI